MKRDGLRGFQLQQTLKSLNRTLASMPTRIPRRHVREIARAASKLQVESVI